MGEHLTNGQLAYTNLTLEHNGIHWEFKKKTTCHI